MIWPLPLAAGDGWVGVVVFLVIMIISAVSQMAGNKKPAPRPPAPRPRPPVRPPQAGPGGQGQVAQELEDFLRRAAGGRPGPARPQGQAPPQQPPRQQPARPPVRQPQTARPQPARPGARPPVARPVVAQPVDELEVIESFEEHVGHSVGSLQAQLARREEQEESRRAFDHAVGQLDSAEAQKPQAAAMTSDESPHGDYDAPLPSSAAAGFAAMLGSPTSLRQAILLSEIIQRPEHRWT